MARVPRALLLIVLMLGTSCRLSPAHREAFVRYAVSTILDFASTTDDPPAVPAAAHTVRRLPMCAYRAAAAREAPKPLLRRHLVKASAETAELIPVRPVPIATSALRPALERFEMAERFRFDVGPWRIVQTKRQLESLEKLAVRCREASIRAEAIREELRAAHVLLPVDNDNSCLLDPDDPPIPVLDVRVHRTIGG